MKAVEVKPDSAEIYNYIGMCYGALKEYGKAIEAVRNALYYGPDNFQYHFNLASLLAVTGKYRESRAELEESLRLNPNFTKAHVALQQLDDFLRKQQ